MEPQTLACRIGAGLSTSPSAREAASEAARAARGGRGRDEVDLAFVFVSPAHLEEVEAAAEAVREELAPRHLLGCVAEGVVAGVRELEQGPAVAVWAAAMWGIASMMQANAAENSNECFIGVLLGGSRKRKNAH